MSVSVDTGGKSGKKSVNADLNLVPYIDLLTCMVSFLLITAVWTQLARLEVQQKAKSASGETPPPEIATKIIITVDAEGYNVVENETSKRIPKQGDAYNFADLSVELKRLKEAHPDTNDLQVASEDPIKFDILVQTMDAALGAHFPAVSLTEAAAGASL
ncbi:MAG: biopolymer transporter ExbD [Deltaproteobacteria bacterium]|nr:biopolymer transporter ExbD [Deltaproteobacteria bacterium]